MNSPSATAWLACGALWFGVSGPVAADSAGNALTIGAIQGPGMESPYVGTNVSVSGIVTGDFQDHDADTASNLGGFYLQDAEPDRDPRTSDGIFVYEGRRQLVDVHPGDRVTVSGIVKEHFGETQITATTLSIDGTGRIAPKDLQLPTAATVLNADADDVPALEHLEGMLLRLPQTLTVTDLFNLERFGEVGLSVNGRLIQFTNMFPPSRAGYADHQRAIARRSLLLDDGQRAANLSPIRYLMSSTGQVLRAGDEVGDLVGNLRYSRGSGGSGNETWRLMPVADPAFSYVNGRPPVPAKAGTLRIASFNLMNYFSRLDNGQNECGPHGAAPCRGADTGMELERQQQKIVTALAMIDADIVALIELENDEQGSLRHLVDALNKRLHDSTYAFVNTGTIGGDTIKSGFLYKPATVALHEKFALLDSRVDPRFDDRRNRPPLAQTFIEKQSGARLTVVVNHLKSKGSACDAEQDPNLGDGQGNCNQTRSKAAAALVRWIASGRAAGRMRNTLLVGDFNAYLYEQPLSVLAAGNFVNLLHNDDGVAYSYVFAGQAGALDHVLASPDLIEKVVQVVEWHINADESPAHDYNLEHGRNPALFDAASPYRSSDHDPLIVDLRLADGL